MILRNLTNSPYEVPVIGGFVVVPAFDGIECEPTPEFLANLDPSFWAVETQADAAPKKRGWPRKTDAA